MIRAGSEGNGFAIPEIGITQARHCLSHHNADPVVLERLPRSEVFLMQQFSHSLDQLRSIQDGDEPLLDRTIVLFGSGTSYSDSPAARSWPSTRAHASGKVTGKSRLRNSPSAISCSSTAPAARPRATASARISGSAPSHRRRPARNLNPHPDSGVQAGSAGICLFARFPFGSFPA